MQTLKAKKQGFYFFAKFRNLKNKDFIFFLQTLNHSNTESLLYGADKNRPRFNRTKYLEINQTNKAASAFSRARCSPSRHLFHQIKAIIGHSYKSKTP